MKANAAAISRKLVKHGFMRSVESATRIRGWHDYTTGFQIGQYGSQAIINYRNSIRNSETRTDFALNAIANYLRKEGYNVVTVTEWAVVIENKVA